MASLITTTEVQDRARQLQPFLTPGAVYLTGEDAFRIRSLNSSSVTALRVVGRMLTLEGEVRPFLFDHTMNTDRTAAQLVVSIGNGWLLDFSVFAASGTALLGQIFVRVELVRGLGSAAQFLATLAQGVCNAVQALAYPGSAIRATHEAPGIIRSITGTDPAAGAEIVETVPTGARWRLLSLLGRLVNDATVASRQVRLVVDDGTTAFWQTDPPENHTASQDAFFMAAEGSARLGIISQTRTWMGPTHMIMLAGYRVRTSTANLQAGDNWGAPQLLVEEWLEGN